MVSRCQQGRPWGCTTAPTTPRASQLRFEGAFSIKQASYPTLNYCCTHCLLFWVSPTLYSPWHWKRPWLQLLFVLFLFFFPLLKIDVEIQLNGSLLGLTVEKGLDLSFSQIRENPCCKKNKKRSTELSPASPQQRSRVWTALVLNAGRSGTVSPAIRLVRGWVNSSKLLLAETALNQPALKWKRPLKWCYWQCFNISHIFQERSVYPITADPAFFATYVSKINLFLWTQHSSS